MNDTYVYFVLVQHTIILKALQVAMILQEPCCCCLVHREANHKRGEKGKYVMEI